MIRGSIFVVSLCAILAYSVSGFAPHAITINDNRISGTTTISSATTTAGSTATFFSAASSKSRLAVATLDKSKTKSEEKTDSLISPNERIYSPKSKETPKVLGGVKIGLRKLVVVTGASSGLGLATAVALANTGKYYVVMACRNVEKAKKVAKEAGLPKNAYTVMKLELANLQSVRDFVANLKAFKSARPLTHLICNAAVYRPTDPEPMWTDDGFEMSMGVNHLGHFLLVNLLLDDMSRAKGARVCIVGSITGNSNTVAGGLVYPKADLGKLEGFEKGGTNPVAMADGKPFFGAKAYKDSKVCNMMTVSELHRRYHDETGIVFSSIYPGCIAETGLFREKREWFRKIFPLFMKYVTGGYVSEREAGERLAQVIDDPGCDKSGVYWSWKGSKGSGGSGGDKYENEQSDAVKDTVTAKKMWDTSKTIVKLSDKDMYRGGKFED